MHRHPAKLQAWNPSLEKVDQTHPGVGPSQFQPLQAWMRSNQHGTFTHGAPIMCPCMWHAWVDQPHMLVICCVGMHCTLADTTPSCMHGRAVHTCTTTTMCNPSMPHAIMATHLMPEAPCMQTNAPPTSHIATLSVCSSPTLVGGCMHALECINMVQHTLTCALPCTNGHGTHPPACTLAPLTLTVMHTKLGAQTPPYKWLFKWYPTEMYVPCSTHPSTECTTTPPP